MDEFQRVRAAKQLLSGISAAASLFAVGGPAHADITYKAPASDTTLFVRGYVKADAIWSDRSTGVDSVGDQELLPGAIPVGPTAGDVRVDRRDQVYDERQHCRPDGNARGRSHRPDSWRGPP